MHSILTSEAAENDNYARSKLDLWINQSYFPKPAIKKVQSDYNEHYVLTVSGVKNEVETLCHALFIADTKEKKSSRHKVIIFCLQYFKEALITLLTIALLWALSYIDELTEEADTKPLPEDQSVMLKYKTDEGGRNGV